MSFHKCDACVGSGAEDTGCPTDPCPVCPATRCPVCQGAGRLPDQMPAKDALADAETLRAFVRDPHPPHLLLRVLAPDAYAVDPRALRCGVDAALWKRGHFYETEGALVDDATWAARAAFRAVPGLKVPDFEHECAVCA